MPRRALGRLRETGYLNRPRTGTYQLTDLVPLAVVLDEVRTQDVEEPSPVPPQCREWMPRAKAYCALNTGPFRRA